MIIKYKNYTNGIHEIFEEEKAKNLGLTEHFKNDIALECRMDKSNHQIILDCTVKGNAEFSCDRCNEEFEMELSNSFQVSCFFEEKDTDDDEINIKFLTADQDKIDITEEIKDYLLLSIPMKALCDEECKGLCPSCGQNLNESTCSCSNESTTSVWEPLKKLKDNLNN